MKMKSFVIYVPNRNSNTVSVIDTINQITLTTIAVGTGPSKVILSDDNSLAICCNTDSNTISVIDTITNSVLETIPVGISPIDGVFLPDNLSAFIINRDDNSIYKINLTSMRVDSTLGLAFRPVKLALTKNGSTLYVAGLNSSILSVVDTSSNSILEEIQLPTATNYVPIALKFTPDESVLFYSSSSSPMLATIDPTTNKVVDPVYYGSSQTFIPQDFVISPDGKFSYLVGISGTAGLILQVSTSMPLNIITSSFVFSIPYKAAISSDNKYLITANTTSRNVFIFDITDVNNYWTIYTSGSPSDITVSTKKPQAYVVNKGLKELTCINIDTKTIFTSYPVGDNPYSSVGGIIDVNVPSSLITKRPLKSLEENITIDSSTPTIIRNINLNNLPGNPQTIRGTVTDMNNFPIKGASIYIVNSDGHAFDVRYTDNIGSYSFSLVNDGNYYDLIVSSPDYHYSDKKTITITSEEIQTIDFKLTEDLISTEGVLSGIILDNLGNTLDESSINIYSITVGATLPLAHGMNSSYGYFYFPFISSGPYVLKFNKPGYLPSESLVIINKVGQVSNVPVVLSSDPSNPTGKISGTVRDAEGNLASHVSVSLYSFDSTGSYLLSDKLTGLDGTYEFNNLRDGNYFIEALTFTNEAPA